MSLEQSIDKLTAAVNELFNAVINFGSTTANISVSAGGGTAEAPPVEQPKTEKAAPAETKAELKSRAKEKLMELAKAKGDESAKILLAEFGVRKFSSLKTSGDTLEKFIAEADKMIANEPDGGEPDDDFLGEGDDKRAEVSYTMDDIKSMLLAIANSKELGKESARKVLTGLKLKKVTDMKKEHFADAAEAALALLEKVGKKFEDGAVIDA